MKEKESKLWVLVCMKRAVLAGAGPSAAPAGEGDKATAVPATVDEATPMDEDALLQQALAMSMQVRRLDCFAFRSHMGSVQDFSIGYNNDSIICSGKYHGNPLVP